MNKGNQLRDLGMNTALMNAESKNEGWGEEAYSFLVKYSKTNKQFLAEDVRVASENSVPEPPNKRAWGSIFVRANKEGIIRRIGFLEVNNPKAHRTPASLWQVADIKHKRCKK